MGYLTALARTGLDGELNYTDRNVVEKLFQTYTMRIGLFHETWNGGQLSAERWLTAYTFYYNHLRGHQALDDQPPDTEKFSKSTLDEYLDDALTSFMHPDRLTVVNEIPTTETNKIEKYKLRDQLAEE